MIVVPVPQPYARNIDWGVQEQGAEGSADVTGSWRRQ